MVKRRRTVVKMWWWLRRIKADNDVIKSEKRRRCYEKLEFGSGKFVFFSLMPLIFNVVVYLSIVILRKKSIV